MKKINILTKSVYNKIAAGEVVDRPYSVVKELVENSLDAGANDIEVHIEQGGKQLIKVLDNGSGIDRDDMRAAFFPHATSKISKAEDINEILTLGFRGEALASISAVSRVELTSVTEGNPAYKVCCEDGNIGAVNVSALEKGTEICVRDLFYNVPARAKFLKTDKKEENDITSLVTRFILGKPDVAFRYFVDGKLTLQSDGSGFDDAVARIYGAKTIARCYKINASEGSIKIRGYISDQNYLKPNKTYQTTFLNGRYIINNVISNAVARGYSAYMMKRQYPFYVLNIEVDPKFIDVNVHPNKMDVRILNDHSLFSFIYTILTEVLDGHASAVRFIAESSRMPEIKSTNTPNREDGLTQGNKPVMSSSRQFNFSSIQPSRPSADGKPVKKYYDPFEEELLFDCYPKKEQPVISVSSPVADGAWQDKRLEEAQERVKYEQQMIDYESCKYKGNLFNTYLIYEICDTVYIIDQHAAHERLIYDRLREKIRDRNINRQLLLSSFLLTTTPEEHEFIEKNARLISNLGFTINPFGVLSYRIDTVPADLQHIDIEEFFNDLLSDIKDLSEIKLEEVLKDKIAMTACKHAVRGGKELTADEVDVLFRQLKGNMGLKCPHGRPICVSLEKKDLEKMFKRIV